MRIVGVPCAACIVPIRRRLERTLGVKWVGANVVLDLIFVDYDPDVTDRETILATVKKAGYEAVPLAS